MSDARAVREILVATDFSDASEPAVRVARDYATQFGARVHLVHVAPPGRPEPAGRLGGLATTFAPNAVVVRNLPGHSPAPEIVRYAKEHAIDLIVLGTHGRTGVTRALLGSVAEHVVRTAGCPVLTVGVRTPTAAPHEAPGVEVDERQCLVCAKPSGDLICEPCRARIRGELLEDKQRQQRPGR
jgi:nucleotide-binding universal stress UspA family protein